jgi:hypothetical protein
MALFIENRNIEFGNGGTPTPDPPLKGTRKGEGSHGALRRLDVVGR